MSNNITFNIAITDGSWQIFNDMYFNVSVRYSKLCFVVDIIPQKYLKIKGSEYIHFEYQLKPRIS